MTQLIIAEKGSQGKEIAHALGVPFLNGGGKVPPGARAVVVPLAGHVIELQAPEDYDPKYKKWTISSLPILPAPFKRSISNGKYYAPVKELLKDSAITEVVNACDPDREGELIFCEVMEHSKCTKPAKRLWLKDLTDQGVRDAFASLRPRAQMLGVEDAAKCRAEADWLVGMNITRAQTKLAGTKGREGVESVGRCQTPTLAMVVDRELAIRKFVPKPYWRLKVAFQCEKGRYEGIWFKGAQGGQEARDRFEDGAEAQAKVGLVRGQAGKVASVDEHDDRTGPQQFYDIGAIRKEASKRFKFSGDKTNEILQSLYLKKAMSYPRTDFRHITEAEALKLPDILQAVKRNFPQYVPIIEEMEQMGLIGKSLGKRFVDGSKVGEHSALLPTEERPKEPLTEDEKKVFDLVVRRVLAAFYPDQVKAKTTIITEVAGETFVTHGSVLKEEGWARIDPKSRKGPAKGSQAKPEAEEGEEDEEGGALPAVHQGLPVTVADAQAPQEMTKPPKRLKEHDLEELMKSAGKFLGEEELEGLPADFGIGTGATRADIIKTLLDRKYVVKEKEYLVPTEKAFHLMEDLPDPVLRSPQMTAEWERRLGKIERGEDSRDAFMRDINGLVGGIVEAYRGRLSPEALRADQETSAEEDVPLGTCPKCGKGTLQRRRRREGGGYYAKCDRKSCGAYAGVDEGGNLVLRSTPCRFCGAMAVTSSQFGDKCMACDKSQGVLAPVPCDKCGSQMAGLTYQGKAYVKCMDQKGQGCKRSWNTDPTFTTRVEVEVSTPCCKCASKMLPKFHKDAGGHYIKCSNPDCNAWWPTDASYRTPAAGQCSRCRGPLRPTRQDGPVCVKCGTFVNKKN